MKRSDSRSEGAGFQNATPDHPWGGEGRALDPHPDDVTSTDDLALVDAARHGDPLAFGLLYLRPHAAACRIACVASPFSPHAELAVISGIIPVFSAPPPA